MLNPSLRSSGLALLAVGAMLVATTASFALPAPSPPSDSSGDWPWFRGPGRDGRSTGNGLLDRDSFGLEAAWTLELGSGYSSFSVADGKAVTLFSDGKNDVIAAFDAATGKELWRHPFAETYKGHSGSSDGPSSTPAIHGGRVFGLGGHGHLFAVGLEDGQPIWSKKLDGKTDSLEPHYGFATSPVIVNDLVVIQTGGPDGHCITAYEAATGKVRWTAADEPVNYQSATVMTLGGREQIVALNDTELLGLEPATGEILWRKEHGTSAFEAFSQPLELPDDRIVVNSLQEAAAFRVTTSGDGYEVADLWTTKHIQQSYAIPVAHEGHLFGFSRKILVCLDAETGKTVWRSRSPGARSAILVDGRLIMLDSEGAVVVVDASPEGYRELARLPLLGEDTITPPAFAGGRVFARGLEKAAAARVTDRPTPASAPTAKKDEKPALLGKIGERLRNLENAPEPQTAVKTFLAGVETFPIFEGDGIVHFVYHGPAEEVTVGGNFLDPESDLAMKRIGTTDLWARSVTLDPEASWEYSFVLDYGDKTITDPKNPLTATSMFGPQVSVLYMPRFDVPDHLGEPGESRGRIDSFQLKSKHLGQEMRIRLYVPPDYAASGEHRYPLLVATHGDQALEMGKMDRSLDNLIAGEKIDPPLVVFVGGGFAEYGGPKSDAFLKMLSDELLPFVDGNYRTRTEVASRGIYGPLAGASIALLAGLELDETFGLVATQSPYINTLVLDRILERIRKGKRHPIRFWIEQRRNDMWFGSEIAAAKDNERILAALDEGGHDANRPEAAGCWGWSNWRASFGSLLESFFPPPGEQKATGD